MAQLISSSYFINDINLPSQFLTGTTEIISDYIQRYEEDVLKKLLGYDLYKELKALIDATPQVYPSKWDHLVNGAEYSIGSYTREWEGLVNTELTSLIAYYVYYHVLKDRVNSYEISGAVISQGDNPVRTSPDNLMTNAWNNFVDSYRDCVQFMIANQADYPLWLYTPQEKVNIFDI
jgi:hypothetical protein